jgi:hypothetical protein
MKTYVTFNQRLYVYLCNIPKQFLGPALKGMKE